VQVEAEDNCISHVIGCVNGIASICENILFIPIPFTLSALLAQSVERETLINQGCISRLRVRPPRGAR
jgi:hypothetical protein